MSRRSKFAAAVGVAAALTSAALAEDSRPLEPIVLSDADLTKVRAGLENGLKDPESLRLNRVVAGRAENGLVTVCGLANAKNGYGGYTGRRPFIGVMTPKTMVVISYGQTDDEARHVKIMCERRGLTL
ncbi:hypothetical protein [Rhodoligotrophos ferricapiens]|uniref:hypothetical protein n=1 Tax=Rhodoligotrophos ferricapiens TaxID=3069264 RepID=UPI00315D6A36